MAALALGSISLRDADTGDNVTIFDVDPDVYRPLEFPIRGSVFPTLDGGVIRQVMGLKVKDLVIQLEGRLATQENFLALHAKYRQPSGVYEFRDWLDSRYQVIFSPGQISFSATPIPGSCEGGYSYVMSLQVCAILQFYGGSF